MKILIAENEKVHQVICSSKVEKVCRFMGRTTLIKTLSCDSVIDGAFFPQPDFQVPKKKVCQHAC